MNTRLITYIVILLITLSSGEIQAQNGEFRDARARLSVAAGVFTFHGPANLLEPAPGGNAVHVSDPAVALLGSFPLIKERVYFRFMLLLTNLSTADGERIVGSGSNDFLTKNLVIFEPSLVFPVPSLMTERMQPYVFTGFGGTVADAFSSSRNVIDMPGTGIPGPERSAFHIPLGFGADFALTDRVSVFGEASWRLDMNYAFRNETGYEPHSTTLVMGGIRFTSGKPRVEPPEPPPFIKPPPDIDLPPPDPFPDVRECELAPPLTPVFFKEDSAELTAETLAVLDDNVFAVLLNPDCCVKLVGLMNSPTNAADTRLANERVETIREYLHLKGIYASRLTIKFVKDTRPKCSTKPGAEKCPSLMIELEAMDCANLSPPQEPER